MSISLNKKLGYKISDYDIHKVIGDILITKKGNYYGLSSLKTKTSLASILVKPKYTSIKKINDNCFKVTDIDTFGLIDRNGKELLPCMYKSIYDFENGVAVTQIYYYGLVSDKGQIIVDTKYDFMRYLSNDLYLVKNDKYGLINKDGKTILDLKYQELYIDNNYIIASLYGKKNSYGLYDLNGNNIIKHKYKEIQIMSNKLLLVLNRFNNYKVIDYQDNVIKSLPHRYKNISVENNELLKYQSKSNKYGLMYWYGKSVLKDKYNLIDVLKSGMIIADDYVVNLDTQYERVDVLKNDYLRVWKKGRCGLLDSLGNTILNPNYADLHFLSDDYVGVKEIDDDNLQTFSIYNIKTRQWDFTYDYVSGIKGSIGDKFYIINNQYEPLFEIKEWEFNFCDIEKNGNYYVIKDAYDSEYTLIDSKGTRVLNNIKCNSLIVLNDNQVIVDNYLYDINKLKELTDEEKYIKNEDKKLLDINIEDYTNNVSLYDDGIKIKKLRK